MSRKFIQITFSILLLAGMILVFAFKDGALANSSQAEANAKIEGALVDKFATEGTADFIVSFSQKADLSAAYNMDWISRGRYVYDTLTATAGSVQARTISTIEGFGLRSQTFFADNILYVWSGTQAAAQAVATLPEVSGVRATQVYELNPELETPNLLLASRWAGDLLANKAETTVLTPATLDWGIVDTGADQFWGSFGVEGNGVVVASIDTGVDYTHDAIDQNYKCVNDPGSPACWHDPGNYCGGLPCDTWSPVYHGTHTVGTMVGDNDPSLLYQVGMAPEAQWIACTGCPYGGCPDFDLFSCGDWIIAPDGNPDNRPNVVNNSWGGGGGNPWFQAEVQSWVAAGIFPAFSAGNNYSCNSLGSPGDLQEAFGSAAHRSDRVIADFSSKGPSFFGDEPYTKPNLSAPGQDIMSAMPGDGWQLMSGTSMASPHTAGAVALLWSCNPGLIGQIDQTFQILQDNTDTPPDGSCGAPADGEGNFTYGYGYLDVLKAGFLWCGDTGFIDGHVYDATNDEPIASASVHAVGTAGGGPTAYTDPTGYYTMTVVEGTYTVTASAYTYVAQSVTGVEVVSDTTTTVDFSLTPQGLLEGYVTDFDNGFPLVGATVAADNGTTTTTDDTGYYQLYLDEGTYDVIASMQNYADDTQTVDIVSGQTTQQDFVLEAAVAFVPNPVHVTLDMETTDSLAAEVFNRQGFDYPFAFNERNGGYIPAVNGGWIEYLPDAPAVSRDLFAHNGPISKDVVNRQSYRYHGTSPLDVAIIIYNDDDQHFPSFAEQALQTLGLSYTFYGNPGDPGPLDQFTNAVNGGGWDLVILAQDGWIYLDAREYTAVNNHLLNGGSAIVDSWGIGYGSTQYTNPLWATMGVTFASWVTQPESMYWWDPGNPIFASVPEFTQLTNLGYLAYGAEMTVIDGVATSIGGFNTVPTPGDDGLVVRDDFLSIYKGLTDNLNSADQDSDGPDAWELWVNAISFILNPNIDVPWLGEVPTSGTVPAEGSFDVTLLFSATQSVGINQPGDYFGSLVLNGNPKLEVPVTMTVLPPETWGKVEGVITDYCTGEPIPEVVVSIPDGVPITETVSDDAGVYWVWLEAGNYDATFKADGFLDTPATLEVLPGEITIKDLAMRPDVGCLTIDPTSLEVTLEMGEQKTETTDFGNVGGTELAWEIREKDKGFTPAVDTPAPVINPLPVVANPGTASVLQKPAVPGTEEFKPVNPNSWVAGSPYPMGIVRYAKVQCPGDTNSFYIIGGVSNGMIVNNVNRYDADTATWTPLAPISSGVQENPSAVCYDGKIYSTGGGYVYDFYIYDIATDTWTSGPSMSRGVEGAAMAGYNGKIYVIGGDDDFYPGSGVSDQVNIYDIETNSWVTNGTPMPTGIENGGTIQLGQYVFVVGGWWPNSPASNSNLTLRYDIETDTWETGPAFTPARADIPLAATINYLYVMGGDQDGGAYFDSSNVVWRYDFNSWPDGVWEDVGDNLPWAIQANNGGFATDSVVGGEIWSVGGLEGSSFTWHADNVYRESEAPWSPTPPDVLWVSEDPVSGTLAVDASETVFVTFDASVVNQPGAYKADLNVKTDSRYGGGTVAVTMNVVPPPTWGKFTGTVTDACTGAALNKVTVNIELGDPITQTLTNKQGVYAVWLEQGTYDVSYSLDGYLSSEDVADVVPGGVTTIDVQLVPDRPCIKVSPDMIEAWVLTDTQVYTTEGLLIANPGGQDLTYAISEKLAMKTADTPFIAPAQNNPLSGNKSIDQLVPAQSIKPNAECIVALTAGTDAIEQQQFHDTLDELGYSWVDVYTIQDAYNAGANVLIDHYAAYNLPVGDINTWLSGGLGYIELGDWPQYFPDSWEGVVADTPVNIEVVDSSHPLMSGLPDAWVGQGFWAYDWPGSNAIGWVTDPSYPNVMRAGAYSMHDNAVTYKEVGDGKAVYIGVNVYGYKAGDNDKQLLDNAVAWTGGCGVPTDVPWVWEEPVSGTVTAGGVQDIGIYLTSQYTDGTPMPLGTYTVTLTIENDDPVAKNQKIPVVMHVVKEYLAPVPEFTASTADVGNPTEFVNTSDPGIPPTKEYEWNFGDGVSLTVGTMDPVYHTYSTFGTFTVTLTACNVAGCETVVHDVMVLPKVLYLPLMQKN